MFIPLIDLHPYYSDLNRSLGFARSGVVVGKRGLCPRIDWKLSFDSDQKKLKSIGTFVKSEEASRYWTAPFDCHFRRHLCIFILLNKLYR